MSKRFVLIAVSMLVLMIILLIGSNIGGGKQEVIADAQNEEVPDVDKNVDSNTEKSTDNTASGEKQVVETTSNKSENSTKLQNESEVDKSKNKKSEPTGNTTYYIKVNYKANTVTIYEKDDNGYYTIPVKAMICSCGTATPTSGVYKTSQGYEWGYLEGGTFGRYSTRIKGGIMFHSVPYVEEREDTLEYWEYDKLGTTASLGCVRLCVRDCKWIFDNCEVGTQVEFYADSNPGPLGKPSAQKISDNEECRNWDPTDPSPSSPWNS